jgi:CRP-like cAMP-binding protein
LSASEKSAPNQRRIAQLPTQQDLATQIWSQRESVGREMSKLKEQGLILRDGKSLRILDVLGLESKLRDF